MSSPPSSPPTVSRPWAAPAADGPVLARVTVPGSKSETNRALVLAALASGPSTVTGGLAARDTALMREALRTLGVTVTEAAGSWRIGPPTGALTAGGTVDCGLAGTVMRFVPPVAALAPGPVRFDGDAQAYGRPMGVILDALAALGAEVDSPTRRLPFTLTGDPALPGGLVTVDASASSQFVSGLLLAGARYADGLDLRHDGGLEGRQVPSLPHVAMTVAMLRDRGVAVDDREPDRWVVAPGPIAPRDVAVEPDLSNAAPFLAAAVLTGGTVTVPGWPSRTHQPGDHLRDILSRFGAEVALTPTTTTDDRAADGELTVRGTGRVAAVDLDLHEASELTPVVAALAAVADGTSHLRGVAHIRGHETDRLAALAAELTGLGARATETADGLVIEPRPLAGGVWRTYADHRMAQAGALLGLVVPGVELDDLSCTAKTMPEFGDLWREMLETTAVSAGR